MTPDTPLALADRILYRDGLILVIDKPAGIPVHAGPKGGVNLEQGFDALRFGLPQRPALAHRLDRDTSGCLILGRHTKALRRMGRLFSEGRVKKTYWALVQGVPAESAGQIALPLRKRSTEQRGWWMETHPDGMTATTDYEVCASHNGMSWLVLSPHTGRTHQIRVHCAAIGCPIIGDPIYGQGGCGLMLHARALEIPLYPAKDPVCVTAEPPEAFAAVWARIMGDGYGV
jgi:tRNA pseudouridine32 synthase/23S rRNA pseudouridine746 synthase/23S rRNA pseudouridine1911/1915/1917 synthase